MFNMEQIFTKNRMQAAFSAKIWVKTQILSEKFVSLAVLSHILTKNGRFSRFSKFRNLKGLGFWHPLLNCP